MNLAEARAHTATALSRVSQLTSTWLTMLDILQHCDYVRDDEDLRGTPDYLKDLDALDKALQKVACAVMRGAVQKGPTA